MEPLGAFAVFPFWFRLLFLVGATATAWAFCGVAVAYYRSCKADPNQAIPPLLAVLGVCLSGPLPTILRVVAWFKAPSFVLLMLLLASSAMAGESVTVTAEAVVADDYAAAYQRHVERGDDLLVLLSTDWCGPCRRIHRETLPVICRAGGLPERVAFVRLNPDSDAELAADLAAGVRSVPLWVLYRRDGTETKRRDSVGFKTAAQVKEFIGAK